MLTLALLAQEQVPELPAYGFQPNLASLLSFVITVLLPLLVGLVTRRSTHPGLKALLLLALAALNTIVTAWYQAENTGADFVWLPVVYTTAINFAIAVAVHFGLWKPTGTTATVQDSLVKD